MVAAIVSRLKRLLLWSQCEEHSRWLVSRPCMLLVGRALGVHRNRYRPPHIRDLLWLSRGLEATHLTIWLPWAIWILIQWFLLYILISWHLHGPLRMTSIHPPGWSTSRLIDLFRFTFRFGPPSFLLYSDLFHRRSFKPFGLFLTIWFCI